MPARRREIGWQVHRMQTVELREKLCRRKPSAHPRAEKRQKIRAAGRSLHRGKIFTADEISQRREELVHAIARARASFRIERGKPGERQATGERSDDLGVGHPYPEQSLGVFISTGETRDRISLRGGVCHHLHMVLEIRKRYRTAAPRLLARPPPFVEGSGLRL